MRTWTRILGIALCLCAASSACAAPFRWALGEDVAAPLFDRADADPGVICAGADLLVQTARWPDWRRFRGRNFDDLAEIKSAQRDTSFNQPHGDDAYWTNGMWRDDARKFYAVVHIEFNYAQPRREFLWRRRIGLATSEDEGAHWHYEGDILTTNPERPGRPGSGFQDFGAGDTYLCVDRQHGFFYLFYMTAWIETATGRRVAQAVSVARSSFAAKMAPGSWTKWHAGGWRESGLGGAESVVFSDADSAVVHFNTYLKAFVAIGRQTSGRAWIASCTSLAAENWTSPDDRFPTRLLWYNWPVDPKTQDRYEIGREFRLYSSQAGVSGVGAKYMDVRFSRERQP